MIERYDALTVRESNGKSYFTKIGAAFKNKQGEGYTLMLDAVPASNDGQYRILLSVPKPRDDRERSAQNDRQQAQQRSQGWGGNNDQLDDDIPF